MQVGWQDPTPIGFVFKRAFVHRPAVEQHRRADAPVGNAMAQLAQALRRQTSDRKRSEFFPDYRFSFLRWRNLSSREFPQFSEQAFGSTAPKQDFATVMDDGQRPGDIARSQFLPLYYRRMLARLV